MTLTFRKLDNNDSDIFEAFLKNYEATSMFLRSNVRRVGLEFKEGPDYHAHYYGAFDHGKLIGIVALNWNSNLFMQVTDPEVLKQLLTYAALDQPSFRVRGIVGPDTQAQLILEWLQPSLDTIQMSSKEIAYSLLLEDMVIPAKLLDGIWQYRLAQMKDVPQLIPWRLGYETELVGGSLSTAGGIAEIEEIIHKKVDLKEIFLLEDHGQVVSRADYNATLPDVYQIGGVWTPPHFRNKGYARGAVAGALLTARENGVQKAILFTKNPAAMRSYESLGFKAVDDYHITFFKEPISLTQISELSNHHQSQ